MVSALDRAKQHYNDGRLAEALTLLQSLRKADPRNLDAVLLEGMVEERLGNAAAAAQLFRAAMDLSPNQKKDIGFRAATNFLSTGQTAEALGIMRSLFVLMPEDQNVIHSVCSLLRELGRYQEAAPFAEKLGKIARDFEGLLNAGIILSGLGRHEEAFPLLGQAFALRPEERLTLSELFWAASNLCEFDACQALQQTLLDQYKADGNDLDIRESAFRALMWSGDEAYLAKVGARTSSGLFKPVDIVADPRPPRRPGRLRIGYVSNDFYDHATMSLLAGVLEAHDREAFEIFAFCHTEQQNRKGVMRKRFLAACEHMVDILDVPDEAVIEAIRQLDIDILVDLKGFTQGSRLSLFKAKPARHQITWLGFPGTVPGAGLDFAIGDRFVTPPESQPFFAEKLLRMPASYQCNDAGREPVSRTGSRADHGLPENAIVFSSFNQAPKIRRPIFAAWMQILKSVEDSVLWLGHQNRTVVANLRAEARRCGIDPARLVFADLMPLADHLRRLPQADIALDTAPCNGHTTTSDALWAGVPVVTVKGTSFAGRVSESLLNAVGLPHLVAKDLEAYVKMAVQLGNNRPALADLRSTLITARTTSPLFNSQQFARDLESLYGSVAV